MPGQNVCLPDDDSQASLGGIPYQTGPAKITHGGGGGVPVTGDHVLH